MTKSKVLIKLMKDQISDLKNSKKRIKKSEWKKIEFMIEEIEKAIENDDNNENDDNYYLKLVINVITWLLNADL